MSETPATPWADLSPSESTHPAASFGFTRSLSWFSSSDALPPILDRAAAALDMQVRAAPLSTLLDGSAIITDLVWVRLDVDPGCDTLRTLCERITADALTLVIETTSHLIDAIWDVLSDCDNVSILLDPDEGETLLALSRILRGSTPRLNSPLVDAREQQLDRLQEEVHRISRLLARLSLDGGAQIARMPDGSREPPSPFIEDHQVQTPVRGFHGEADSGGLRAPVSPHQVRLHIRQRRLREEYFSADMFADPAWDMMLDLYAARLERLRVSVSSLCIAAAVPATTALRWIKTLTESGVLERRDDPHDGRRIFVALSDQATQALHGYFRRIETDN